jgi:hypothetical protein
MLVKREDIEREFALKLVWEFVVERLLKAGQTGTEFSVVCLKRWRITAVTVIWLKYKFLEHLSIGMLHVWTFLQPNGEN